MQSPVAQAISRELDTLRQLLALLQQEQALITARSLEALTALLEEKTTLSRTLEQHSAARLEASRAAGVADSASELTSWLQKNDKQSLPLWEQTQELARQAALTNQHNGQLINQRQQLEQQFLRQCSVDEDMQAYNPQGQLPGTTTARRRDSA